MMAICGSCGKDLAASPTGRPKAYCDDRCRNAAREARATEQARADHRPAPAPETPQRRSYGRGMGDGDDCPQDRSHGAMYFIGDAKRIQWCPSSRHQGGAFYAHDGVTPTARSAPDLVPGLGTVERGLASTRRAASSPASRPAAETSFLDDAPPPAVPTTVGSRPQLGASDLPAGASLADPAAVSPQPTVALAAAAAVPGLPQPDAATA